MAVRLSSVKVMITVVKSAGPSLHTPVAQVQLATSEELDLLQCLFSSGIYYLSYAVNVEVSLRPAFFLSSASSIPHHCSTGATVGLCYLNCSLPHSSTPKDSSDIYSTLHSS